MKTDQIRRRPLRTLALGPRAVLLAAGLASTMLATSAWAQAESYDIGFGRIDSTRAPRGADGENVTFDVPVLVNVSLDLSGNDGLDGADGIHYPTPFGLGGWYTTASMGGHGGQGGDFILNAGGTIALSGTQFIAMHGGRGGDGGVSLSGFFGIGGPPNHHTPDGSNGIGGDLILNAPTQFTLTGFASVTSSNGPSGTYLPIPPADPWNDPIPTDAGQFRSVGLNGYMTNNSRLSGFTQVTLDQVSQLRLDSFARFDVGHCDLRGGSSLRVEDSAIAIVADLDLAGASSVTTFGGTLAANKATVDASQISVQGGVTGFIAASDSQFTNASELRLSGGTLQISGSRGGNSGYDSLLHMNGSLFQQSGGVFNGENRTLLRGTNGATINLFAGTFGIDGRAASGNAGATAIQLTDSDMTIGSNGNGPSVTIRTPLSTPAISLERSTLTYAGGALDINSSIKMDAASVFNVNAAAFDAGFVSGSLDRSAGTVNVTDVFFTLGEGSALGRLLGGANTTIGRNFALTGTTFVITPTNLTIENGGRVASANVVGITSAPLSFGSDFSVTTSLRTSVSLNAGVLSVSRQASSSSAPVLEGVFNLAQGTLTIAPTEGGSSARETIRFTGSATNGTIRVTPSFNASVLFQSLTGNAILNTGAVSPGTVARVNDASFGGINGAGRIDVAGPLTISTIGTNTLTAAISGNGPITIGGSGAQEFLASGSFTGGATLRSGVLAIAQGALGNSLISFDGGQLKAMGALTIGNQLRIEDGGASINLNGHTSTIALPIVKMPGQSDGGLVIAGGGQVNLAAGATYAGGTSVRDGVLVRVPSASALGTGPVTLDGGTILAAGSISSLNTLRVGTNGATLDTGGPGNTMTWSHDIADAPGASGGALFIQGGGVVTLNGAKSYSAITVVDQTTVAFNTPAAFGSGPIIANGATLRSNGMFSLATSPLMISAGGVRVELNNSLISWNAQISPFFASNGGLTLSGTGGMILLQPNTYTGPTTVSGGTLAAFNTTGSATGSGSILVNGGVLSGIGIYGVPTVQSNVQILAGTIAPGDGPQTLTFANGGLMRLDGGEVVMELGATSDLITFASLADRLRGTGTTLRLIAGEGFSYQNRYPIFSNVLDAGGQFSFASIVSVHPNLTPVFAYDATSSSYVVSFIPSPASLALLMGAGLMGSRRRR